MASHRAAQIASHLSIQPQPQSTTTSQPQPPQIQTTQATNGSGRRSGNFPQGLLAGQVAIVTGSGQGIGAETARLFAGEGARVVVGDVDAEKAEAVVKAINETYGDNDNDKRAIAVPGDMLDAQYIDTLVKKAAEFGRGKIHIIVNNAGFTWDGVIHKMTDKQWDTIIALHNTAPFKLVRAAAPYFRVKDGEPRNIINISSTSGVNGNAGQANYGLAKAGIIGLSKVIAKVRRPYPPIQPYLTSIETPPKNSGLLKASLTPSQEWGPQFGVRANTIAFGHILTRLTAAKEAGAFITTPDGEKVALGIPRGRAYNKNNLAVGGGGGDNEKDTNTDTAAVVAIAHADIPLRRPGTATEAASVVLAVASPLFGYVSGQTIMCTGGRNM
ncbi:hypothetical protein MMC24_001023 [Lignoscripta atroalba]|nr:hypothetical protein [Lignoscripta atroalba]